MVKDLNPIIFLALYLPNNAKVTYNGNSNWVWKGKTLTNTVNFFNGLTVTSYNSIYLYLNYIIIKSKSYL